MNDAKLNIDSIEDAIDFIKVPSLTKEQKSEILLNQIQLWKQEGKPSYSIATLNLLYAELQLDSF